MVSRCGGIPILIPPGSSTEIIDNIDGLIISGGPDISPEIYGQENGKFTIETYPEQDASEIALIKSAIKNNLPLLCICRGFQLLCAIHDGSLHQHLPQTDGYEEHGGWDGNVTEHGVNIIEGSRLEEIMGDKITVNSTHHQGVKDPGSLKVTAFSSHDGLIEAVEIEKLSFCIGVQWHPERIEHVSLYKAFIDSARGS
jgi:putative glutamine amidotransferase|tara:strand:+ start:580 stop:1173 length:594 start_codon:yes stop_codon:yes gene_type:complete